MTGGARQAADSDLLVSPVALQQHCSALLAAAGLDGEAAGLVADSLVDAEMRGIASHGVTRARIYAGRLRAGLVDPAARPVVVAQFPGGGTVDARNAMGHLGACAGVDLAVDGAETNGAHVVGVINSNHCGALGYFARRATRRGLAVLAMSTAPPTMAYFGGRTRAVGTNPICLAAPCGDRPPVVLDIATSATARGKILVAEQLGAPIPVGCAVDAEGHPTTDAMAALAGAVLPFAGAKGSGLAMMVDLLCGGLLAGVSGRDIGDMYDDWDRPQRVTHLFVVVDPDRWIGRAAFADHVRRFAATVHALPPAAGIERVLLPGEVEEAAAERAQRDGVPLPRPVAADLDELAGELGVPSRLSGASTRQHVGVSGEGCVAPPLS
jgi:LDH2 family malate/lactate/ureidoglycolate dehydrogenase